MSERLSQDEVTDLIVAVVDRLAAKGIEAGVSTDYSSGDLVMTVTIEGRAGSVCGPCSLGVHADCHRRFGNPCSCEAPWSRVFEAGA